MSLRRSDRPEYTLKLPISKETVRFSSFTMRAERTLMLATQGENQEEIINAVCNVIDDHLRGGDIKAEDLPQAEAELLLLNMRAKSIGEKINLIVTDPEDEKSTYEVAVDLNKITIKVDKDFSDCVELKDGRVIKFALPGMRSLEGIDVEKESEFDVTMKVLAKSIKQVIDGEEVYSRGDVSTDEFLEFVLDLDQSDFQKISSNFFSKIPTLSHMVKFKRKDGTSGGVLVEGVSSFL